MLRNCHVIYARAIDGRARVNCKECTHIDLLVGLIPISILSQEFGEEGSAISTVTPRFDRARQGQTCQHFGFL